jgi:ELWxxDGT repeat protein
MRRLSTTAARPAPVPGLQPLEPRLLLAAPGLFKEINPRSVDTTFANFVSIRNVTYFTVADDAHGTELWRTDGTLAGTTLLKDIEPGPGSSNPSFLTDGNGTLFFVARTTEYGSELWKSDGTPAGTVLVTDLAPGAASGVPTGAPNMEGMIAFGNGVLFAPTGGTLWVSDGTAAGTRAVDEAPNFPNFNRHPANYTRVGNQVYFTGWDSAHGTELWRTDGTAAGTTVVADVRPGSATSYPTPMGAIGNQLVFRAEDAAHGSELWITDGTPAGTRLLRDIYPGLSGSDVASWAVAGNRLFFNAWDGTPAGNELWVTDGTTAGTRMVRDLRQGINPSSVVSSKPGGFVAVGNDVYFSADDGVNGRELWRCQGADLLTYMVQDLYPVSGGSSFAKPLGVSRGDLYVQASDDVSPGDLWVIRAGTATPVLLEEEVNASAPFSVPGGAVFGGRDDTGGQLWFTNGTPAGTRPLPAPASSVNAGSAPVMLAQLGARHLFVAGETAHGRELWTTDGTPAGTALLKDLWPGPTGGAASAVGGAVFRGAYYFQANDGVTGPSLWCTDGTPGGTRLVKQIKWSGAPGWLGQFVECNGALYFVLTNRNFVDELWRTDGTAAGTRRLADDVSGVPGGYYNDLRAIGGILYFRTSGASSEIYRFDGLRFTLLTGALPYVASWADAGDGSLLVHTTDLTTRLYKLDPKTPATPTQLTPEGVAVTELWGRAGQSFYFIAGDVNTGPELWATDGTPAGTRFVQEFIPGNDRTTSNPPRPTHPFAYRGRLYFVARSGAATWSLWVVDDAAARTPVKLLDLGDAVDQIQYVDFRGELHFVTTAPAAAGRLWKVNATTGAAEVVEADFPYPAGALYVMGDALFFPLADPAHGTEPYRYPALADTTPPAVIESAFLLWSSSQTVSITFDEDLAGLPAPAALQLVNLATGQAFTPSAVTWNPYTRTLAFTTATQLPAGDYRATLAAGSVTDLAGNALASPHSLSFTLLRGDVNGDRTVDFADLLTLARNYNKTDATLADGDFNGDGVVNFADLLLLAKNYNTALPVTPSVAPSLAAPVAAKPTQAVPFSSKPLVPARKPAPLTSRRPPR